MRLAILIACASLSSGCLLFAQTSVRYDATQDVAQLAPRAQTPLGGRIDHGRVALSGSARVEYLSSMLAANAAPTADTRGFATRSPVFSGNVMVGYGVAPIADIFADCSMGESTLAQRTQRSLAVTNTHVMPLVRCLGGGRLLFPLASRLRLMVSLSIGAEGLSVRRNVTETIESFDGGGFRVTERTTTNYDERFGRVLPLGWIATGLLLEPREWMRFEFGGAFGLLATYARSAQGGFSSMPPIRPLSFAQRFDGTAVEMSGQGWLGAAFGPAVARFAVRINVGGGAINGFQIGGEAAMVFSPQLVDPAPRRPQ